MKKRMPIGISDYKKLIESNCYYVDKTLLVKEVCEEGEDVILIPRPRRFGKTINLSMLRYFFEKTGESTAHLFEDKAIWQDEKYRAMQGRHYVIYLSLKDTKYTTYQDVYNAIIAAISDEVKRHKPSLHGVLDAVDEKRIDALIDKSAGLVEYAQSLKFLSRLLSQACKHKTIILLDEYDTPIHSAYHNGFYNEIVNFIRNLMSGAFKDNVSLERGVITGIMRTAKEGIFSGLNNLSVHDMFSEKFSDKFGFTEPEVDSLLEDQELLKCQDDMKSWYNGYTFGNRSDIYNPWSVLECINNNGKISTYWSNTSDNKLIKSLLVSIAEPVKESLEQLLMENESDLKRIVQGIIFPNVQTNNESALWSFLLFSGYLTIGKSIQDIIKGQMGEWQHTLRIPNREISLLYKQLINESIDNAIPNQVPRLLSALVTGDSDTVEELLHKFIINSLSFHDIPKDEPERSYHLFILGLLVALEGRYNVQSNRESGYGRYDVMLIPVDPTKDAGVVIELKKRRPKLETLQEAAQSAINQIHEKKYTTQLRTAGCSTIHHYAIAFEGKDMLMITESL